MLLTPDTVELHSGWHRVLCGRAKKTRRRFRLPLPYPQTRKRFQGMRDPRQTPDFEAQGKTFLVQRTRSRVVALPLR